MVCLSGWMYVPRDLGRDARLGRDWVWEAREQEQERYGLRLGSAFVLWAIFFTLCLRVRKDSGRYHKPVNGSLTWQCCRPMDGRDR